MQTLPTRARENPSAPTPAFDYQAEKSALEAQVHRLIRSIAETAAVTPAEPFLPPPAYPPLPPFQWRAANWTLIGGLLFGVLFWWAVFNCFFPTTASA